MTQRKIASSQKQGTAFTIVRKHRHTALKCKHHQVYKRLLDILGSLIGLLLLAPTMFVIALAIKLVSPGPIFYLQERVTQDGQVFWIFKFRTMTHHAEAQTGAVWVGHNDCRVTPLGRFLRNTHLDESPQLLNVLLGQMSLVGPRPERPVFVEQFKAQGVPGYADRHLVKSGITGYAQLKCPNPTIEEIADKTQNDLWYIENWTPLMDLWLIAETIIYFVRSTRDVSIKTAHKLLRHMGITRTPDYVRAIVKDD